MPKREKEVCPGCGRQHSSQQWHTGDIAVCMQAQWANEEGELHTESKVPLLYNAYRVVDGAFDADGTEMIGFADFPGDLWASAGFAQVKAIDLASQFHAIAMEMGDEDSSHIKMHSAPAGMSEIGETILRALEQVLGAAPGDVKVHEIFIGDDPESSVTKH